MGSLMSARPTEHWKMPHGDQHGHVMTLSGARACVVTFREACAALSGDAAPRHDLRPGESHYVAVLVSVRHFRVFREPRWRRRVHVMNYALGVY